MFNNSVSHWLCLKHVFQLEKHINKVHSKHNNNNNNIVEYMIYIYPIILYNLLTIELLLLKHLITYSILSKIN